MLTLAVNPDIPDHTSMLGMPSFTTRRTKTKEEDQDQGSQTSTLFFELLIVDGKHFSIPMVSKMPSFSEIGPMLVHDDVHAKCFLDSHSSVARQRGSLFHGLYRFASAHVNLQETTANLAVIVSIDPANEFNDGTEYSAIAQGSSLSELKATKGRSLGRDLASNHKVRQRVTNVSVASFGHGTSGGQPPFGSGRDQSQSSVGTTLCQTGNTTPAHLVRGTILKLAGAVCRPYLDSGGVGEFEAVLQTVLSQALPVGGLDAANALFKAFNDSSEASAEAAAKAKQERKEAEKAEAEAATKAEQERKEVEEAKEKADAETAAIAAKKKEQKKAAAKAAVVEGNKPELQAQLKESVAPAGKAAPETKGKRGRGDNDGGGRSAKRRSSRLMATSDGSQTPEPSDDVEMKLVCCAGKNPGDHCTKVWTSGNDGAGLSAPPPTGWMCLDCKGRNLVGKDIFLYTHGDENPNFKDHARFSATLRGYRYRDDNGVARGEHTFKYADEVDLRTIRLADHYWSFKEFECIATPEGE